MSSHADTIRRARSASEYEFGNLNQDQRNLLMALADLGDALLAENQQLRERISARDEILSRWFASYPEDVFLPLSPEQMVKAVDAITGTGITSDALHAAWARHLLLHVMSEIKQADAAAAAALARVENNK
jgi:hypothetical protein